MNDELLKWVSDFEQDAERLRTAIEVHRRLGVVLGRIGVGSDVATPLMPAVATSASPLSTVPPWKSTTRLEEFALTQLVVRPGTLLAAEDLACAFLAWAGRGDLADARAIPHGLRQDLVNVCVRIHSGAAAAGNDIPAGDGVVRGLRGLALSAVPGNLNPEQTSRTRKASRRGGKAGGSQATSEATLPFQGAGSARVADGNGQP